MKKGFLIFLMGIVSFLGINTVSAEEIYLEYNTNVNKIKPYIDKIGIDSINNVIYDLIDYYNENLSNDYPYFYISLLESHTISTSDNLYVVLNAIDNIDINTYHDVFDQSGYSSYRISSSNANKKVIVYNYNENFINDSTSGLEFLDLFSISSTSAIYNVYNYYYSNFDLYYYGNLFTQSSDDLTYLNPDDTLYIPKYDDSSKYSVYKANTDFLIEPYYLYDDNESFKDEIYTTIDLNQYSYVILSLKDYTPRSTFYSSGYYKGQLCITPVFNYGTEEKKDYISGWQAPPCGDYKESYTYHELIIREEDITNHAVLYLTGYDSSKPNLVKVDNSTFNITYITSENENSPNVSIGGKNYNTLPYSSLTDTSALTQQNGIDNTWTCAKYDTDCFLDSSGIDVDNLFSNPLQTLETVWSAITSIFKLIAEFILLLPATMQAFLYLAFGVGIALGIIKILL